MWADLPLFRTWGCLAGSKEHEYSYPENRFIDNLVKVNHKKNPQLLIVGFSTAQTTSLQN